MNRRQKNAIITAAGIAALMVIFPPYVNTGSLMGNVLFGRIWHLPQWDHNGFRPIFAWNHLLLQLATLANVATCAVLACSESPAPRYRATIFLGVATAMAYFAVSLYDMVQFSPFFVHPVLPLGYWVLWLMWCVVACATMVMLYVYTRHRTAAEEGFFGMALGLSVWALFAPFAMPLFPGYMPGNAKVDIVLVQVGLLPAALGAWWGYRWTVNRAVGDPA